MKRIMLGLALGAATLSPAYAQTSPAPPHSTSPTVAPMPPVVAPVVVPTTPHASTSTPAVQTDSSRQNTQAPVPGANSFTESQARSRIEGAGFGGVTGLHKDDQGIWRGHATRAGQPVAVALDYQGNVTGH